MPHYQANKDSNYILKIFLSNFVSEDFFSELINTCLYPSQFSQTGKQNDIVSFIKKFLKDLCSKSKEINYSNLNQIYNNSNIINTILNIRESGASVINYDNVYQHLPQLNITQQNLLKNIIKYRINGDAEFRQKTSRLVSNMETYYELISISEGLVNFEGFLEYASSNSISIFEATKMYKDRVLKLYDDLSKLQTLEKQENEKDYFVIGDKDTTFELASSLVDYISNDYSVFKTGYDLIDDNLHGVESGSLHIISAPSNHGKSIFLSNVFKQIVEKNIDNFESDDGILFLTLEDDIRKLTRRLCSIFGNYEQDIIKKLYIKGYECVRATNDDNVKNNVVDKLTQTFDNVLTTSLYGVTNGKVKLIIKHVAENEFSAGDIGRFLDLLTVEGIKTKMIFLDYLDCMRPTVMSKNQTYEDQGQITQELRHLTKNYKIPIFSATQNKREAENMQFAMSNTMIGDSYNKIRYSDFIYMARSDSTRDVFDDVVQRNAFNSSHYDQNNQLLPSILKLKDQMCEDLIPLEIKITKTKDDGKNKSKYLLFCKRNLRMYNDVQSYLDDMLNLVKLTNSLNSDIDNLLQMAISSGVLDDFSETLDNNCIPFITNDEEEDPFDFSEAASF